MTPPRRTPSPQTWASPGPDELRGRGLLVSEPLQIRGELRYESPAWVFGHRLKNCTVGAFTFFNAAGSTSAYRVQFGRYSQIGESSIIGPPEHPHDWFSNHPFAFTRPAHLPIMYTMPEFVRLAPETSDEPSFADVTPNDTVIGHEAYVGASCFIKRGVTIGDGAVVGARSLVTRDIPPFAVAVGSPARVIRLRFDERSVERLLALQWWRYDLAPWKRRVDFSKVEATLAFLEERLALGELQPLMPDSYRITESNRELRTEKLDQPLFFSESMR